MDELKIAILSDLHAHDQDPSSASAPSYLSTSSMGGDILRHPIEALKKLIRDRKLRADILMCPGDLTDKADPKALEYVWRELNDLKSLLEARFLVATAGNHDMDSRYIHNDYDARGLLQSLDPMFPGLPEHLSDKYWSRNFAILEEDSWRILALNSAAYHGGGKKPQTELNHGRVSRRTVDAIRKELSQTKSKTANILLCHHHVQRDTFLAEGDYSEMDGGDLLLNLLGSGEFGQWLVIHGHKHLPNLFRASGGGSAPFVFAAGSLSAVLYKELHGHARNQFYRLSLPLARLPSLALDLAGKITAWDWIHLRGWQPAGNRSGIPYSAGFGFLPQPNSLAGEIATFVKGHPPFTDWSQLLSAMPQLEFILPKDMAVVGARLQQDHGVNVTNDEFGNIYQLGVSA